MSAFVRLFGRVLLRSTLLDQDLQAGAEVNRSMHQAEKERLSRPRNLPALRLCQRPLLQGVERRHILVQVPAPHVPEDLKRRQLLLRSLCQGTLLERNGAVAVKDRTHCVGVNSKFTKR